MIVALLLVMGLLTLADVIYMHFFGSIVPISSIGHANHLGEVLDKMGERERSLDAFKEIYNADYDYRDVATRVEQSYQ